MTSLTVTTSEDSGPGSLRSALQVAITGDTIIFSPSLSGSTIYLESTLVIEAGVTIDGSAGDKNITIDGCGRVTDFDVITASVTIKNLTIANGFGMGAHGADGGGLLTQNGLPGGNSAGGILFENPYGGQLTLLNEVFIDDHALGGPGGDGGVSSRFGEGGLGGPGGNAAGAIYADRPEDVEASGLQFYGNSAQGGVPGANLGYGPSIPGSAYADTNAGVACFVKGTLIRTKNGELAVESLKVGDPVETLGGNALAVRWIGRRRYSSRKLANNPDLLPIVIPRGSLGAGLPTRELRVSPDHALCIDGLLIPARFLLNQTCIKRQDAVADVEYLHVELDSHAIIFAEGTPTESYIDDNSRHLFENATEFHEFHPEAEVRLEFCARRVVDGYELEAVRRRLSDLVHESVQTSCASIASSD